jgi:hypothetical protein
MLCCPDFGKKITVLRQDLRKPPNYVISYCHSNEFSNVNSCGAVLLRYIQVNEVYCFSVSVLWVLIMFLCGYVTCRYNFSWNVISLKRLGRLSSFQDKHLEDVQLISSPITLIVNIKANPRGHLIGWERVTKTVYRTTVP